MLKRSYPHPGFLEPTYPSIKAAVRPPVLERCLLNVEHAIPTAKQYFATNFKSYLPLLNINQAKVHPLSIYQ